MHTQSLRSRARVGLRPLHKIAKTEDELALQFEAANAGLRKYNATRDRWHEWTGQVWKPDETGSVLDAIRDHIRFAAPPEMHKSGSVRGVESLCRRARVFARIQSDFDRDIYLLGTPEGTVDLRTGRLRKSDPADLISRSTSVSPQAGEPERWLQFLSEATGNDAEYVRHLKQLSGMFLTGDTREHRLSFAYGDGGTGKSTFVNTLGRIWGDYARTAPMETFAASSFDKHPTELAMMAGARLVIANETDQGRKWAAAKIKTLTGGDPIPARFMRQDFFEFVPEFKLLFVGNHAPSFETVDEAMRRRFGILPFDIKPTAKDERLQERLWAEAPLILQWAIDGCLDWQKSGLKIPNRVAEATTGYFEEQDTFGRWLDEHVARGDYKMTTPKSRALTSWNAFLTIAGDRPERDRDLNQRMKRAGFGDGRSPGGKGDRLWLGMELHHGEQPA